MDIPLKKSVSEPKVYALMVESARGQVLHLGVHFSLEEAYAAARQRMELLSPHSVGEAMDIDLWNTMSARQVIALLVDPAKINDMTKAPVPGGTPPKPVDHVLAGEERPRFIVGHMEGGLDHLPEMLQALLLKDPNAVKPLVKATVGEQVQNLKDKKNKLMKKLIADGDVEQVEKLKSVLGPYSRRYVLKAIEKKNVGKPPTDIKSNKKEGK